MLAFVRSATRRSFTLSSPISSTAKHQVEIGRTILCKRSLSVFAASEQLRQLSFSSQLINNNNRLALPLSQHNARHQILSQRSESFSSFAALGGAVISRYPVSIQRAAASPTSATAAALCSPHQLQIVRGMANKRHKKIIKKAKGYRGRANRCYSVALPRVRKALQYAYRDRKVLRTLN